LGPVPAKVDPKGNSVAKRAEKGLVVWEESAELSAPLCDPFHNLLLFEESIPEEERSQETS
jgi:hypothetical protein